MSNTLSETHPSEEITVSFERPQPFKTTLTQILQAAFRVVLGTIILGILSHSSYGQESEESGTVGPPIVNQSGYNLDEAKRFTVPGADDGTSFQIYRYQPPELGRVQPGVGSEVLFSGTIQDEVGYFTDFNPVSSQDQYVIGVEGHGQSDPFWIADHLMEKLSSRLAYQFFIDVRGSTDPQASPARITGGGPSRDGGG